MVCAARASAGPCAGSSRGFPFRPAEPRRAGQEGPHAFLRRRPPTSGSSLRGLPGALLHFGHRSPGFHASFRSSYPSAHPLRFVPRLRALPHGTLTLGVPRDSPPHPPPTSRSPGLGSRGAGGLWGFWLFLPQLLSLRSGGSRGGRGRKGGALRAAHHPLIP